MAITTNILRTKLHPPKTVNDHVHRVRLVEKLNNNFQKNALTLVSAPAGYGKSYLVSCWLTESKIPYGWISLSEDDNDPRTFLEYLLAAVEKVSPEKLEKTSELLQAAELPPVSVITNLLINELDEIEKEFVLVLDDYHLIKEKKIHDLIDGLLQYPPDNMLLCIIARRDPPLKIGSFRAYNRMNEIRMEELSFTVQEIPILYKNMIGLGISEETSERLLKKTEGWVTGLRLTAHSVKTIEQLESMLKKIKGDSRLVTEFLFEEVLSTQPEEYQKYLMKTSLLDRFCSDVVEVLDIPEDTDKENKISGEEFIEWLEKTNLFVIPLDDENKWFRYHHEFKRLLQKQLKKKRSPEQIETIHKKASEWFEKNKLIDEAFDHIILSQDYAKAGQIIRKYVHIYEIQKKWYIIQKMLDRLPESIIYEQAELLLIQAQIHLYQLNMGLIPPLLDRIDGLEKAGANVQKLYGKVSLFKGIVAYYSGNGKTSLENFSYAFENLPADDIGLLAIVELYIALSNQMIGNYNISIEHSKKRLEESASLHPLVEIYINWALIQPQIVHGDLVSASNYLIMQQNLTKLSKIDYAISWCHYLDGYVHLLNGNINEAIELLKVTSEKKYLSNPRSVIDAMALLICAYQANGQAEKAGETLQLFNEFVDYLGPFYQSIADSVNSHYAIMKGDINEAINWVKTNEKPFGEVMIFWYETPCIGWCRALIAEGSDTNLKEAQLQLQAYAKQNEDQCNNFQLIGIKVLQVLAYEKQNETEKALSIMNEALSLAEPGNIVFPFLELGQPMAELLKQLLPDHSNKEFIQTLLYNFEKVETGSEKVHIPDSKDGQDRITEHLTEREIEILTLLSRGLKNREIGDKIFLAQTTIKKHIYNIYQKLDVHSRIEVVNRAKELNIIS